MDESQRPEVTPIASWVSVGFGLVGVGVALWFMMKMSNPLKLLEFGSLPEHEPFATIALIAGIASTLAGIVAIARSEPRRIAITGLVIGVLAATAKFAIPVMIVVLVLVFVGAMMIPFG